MNHSICILTLIRIKISFDNHGDNAQKVYGMVALFTNLEALLGITNACLPIMKPIFIKLYSSMASSWLSNVMSGSIPIFMRPSQMGSAWKPNQSRQTSTYKPPPSNEKSPWRWSKRTDVATPPETQRSPPPRYVDSTSNPNTHPALKSSRPPVPPKSGTYSAPRRWEQENEKAPDAIYVEKSWDVERGSADSDEQALVRDSQNWI